MVDHMPACIYQRGGTLARIDNQIDVSNSHRSCRRPNYAQGLARRGKRNLTGLGRWRIVSADCPEVLLVPFGGTERCIAVEMYVNKCPCLGCVYFNQPSIRSFHLVQNAHSTESCN